jgi:hypothetical protein
MGLEAIILNCTIRIGSKDRNNVGLYHEKVRDLEEHDTGVDVTMNSGKVYSIPNSNIKLKVRDEQ